MGFYNVKTRQKVQVPDKDLKKQKVERKTSRGTQTRYAATAEAGGSKLFRFINEQTFNSLEVPEVK